MRPLQFRKQGRIKSAASEEQGKACIVSDCQSDWGHELLHTRLIPGEDVSILHRRGAGYI